MPHSPAIHLPVSLRRLFPSASFVDCADLPVRTAVEDSRRVGPGDLFAVVRGTRDDGRRHVADAVDRGAAALLVESPLPEVSLPQCVVPSVRSAYARLCAVLHGEPSRRLGVVGVTGTNGKTTVTWLVRSILNAAGRGCGLVGTVEQDDGSQIRPATLTTPDADSLAASLAAMLAHGLRHAAIEVSSHALDQGRTDGVELAAGVVTNVTHDHFDYHGGFDAYRAAKARIAARLRTGGRLVVNAGDPGAASIGVEAGERCDVDGFGIARAFGLPCGFSAEIVSESLDGTEFVLRRGGEAIPLRTPLVGRHNVENCIAAIAAIAAVDGIGVGEDAIREGLESLEFVPGRLERVPSTRPFEVFVDYAHTPDALSRVVASLRAVVPGRLICVFGAGGDRDRLKRPLLGKAASASDVAVVTSDNPRTERPEAIVGEILPGLEGGRADVEVVVDRERAIVRAIAIAEPGDCVLIAGKGHECEQIVGEERLPFDDRAMARDALGRCVASLVPERVSA